MSYMRITVPDTLAGHRLALARYADQRRAAYGRPYHELRLIEAAVAWHERRYQELIETCQWEGHQS